METYERIMEDTGEGETLEDSLTLEEISDHPYRRYLIWNRSNGGELSNPRFYNVDSILRWINTQRRSGRPAVNPETRVNFTDDEINRMEVYNEIYNEYPNKRSFINALDDIILGNDLQTIHNLNELSDYNDILKHIFFNLINLGIESKDNPNQVIFKFRNLHIGNILTNEFKPHITLNLLRAVFRIDFFKEIWNFQKDRVIDNVLGEQILRNSGYDKSYHLIVLRNSSFTTTNEHTIPFSISIMNLNRISRSALGYRNGKGVYTFSGIQSGQDITNLPGTLQNNFLYDYLSSIKSMPYKNSVTKEQELVTTYSNILIPRHALNHPLLTTRQLPLDTLMTGRDMASVATLQGKPSAATLVLHTEPGIGSQSEPERQQWPCPICTFLNDESLVICELCDHNLGDGLRGGKNSKLKYNHIKPGGIVKLSNGSYARKLSNGQLKFIKKP